MKNKLKQLLLQHNDKYFSDHYVEASNLISDMKYIKEHFNRTRLSTFDIKVYPTIECRIYGRFIQDLFKYEEYKSADDIVLKLALFEMLKWMFSLPDSAKLFKELIPIIENLYSIDILEYADCFIGCSGSLRYFYSIIGSDSDV